MPHIIEAEVARHGTELPSGWALQAGPFAALAGAALYLRSRWADLPERFPVHWSVDGRPNGWATRSFAGVFGSLLLAAVIAASMVMVAWLRQRQARTAGYAHVPAAAAERRFRSAMLWAVLATEYLLPGMSYQVADGAGAHRSSTATAAGDRQSRTGGPGRHDPLPGLRPEDRLNSV